MAKTKSLSKKEKCERCKREKAQFLVTELVVSKRHKPAPYRACIGCARRAQNLSTKMVSRLP